MGTNIPPLPTPLQLEKIISSKDTVIHIIGGGGVGMSGLGVLLLELGYQVTSSDAESSPYLENLSHRGATVWLGSQPQKIKKKSVIFYSTAIPPNDPEREYARHNQIPEYPRQPLLRFLTEHFYAIAVSGTHGKTTTSAWLAFLLREAGLDPTILIGGSALDWGSNCVPGKGKMDGKPLLVMEADESDNSFLYISPRVAVVTNIAMDHPDQHSSLKSIRESFAVFLQGAWERGGIVLPSLEAMNAVDQLKYSKDAEIQYPNKEMYGQIEMDFERNTITHQNHRYDVGLRGAHNLYNATCVISLAHAYGIGHRTLKNALKNFRGVARRMEMIYQKEENERKGLYVMDDYAHHPQEIAMVLKTLKKDYDHIFAVWEPHRISRFCYFFDEFYETFEKHCGWDRLILMPTFCAGDQPEDFPTYEEQIGKIRSKAVCYGETGLERQELYDLWKKYPGRSIIVFLGAGRSSREARLFADQIEDR